MGEIATKIRKILTFFFAYFLTVVATLSFSQWIWPEGLQDNAQFIFWPASGVALFLAIRFGPVYAPSILLAVFAAVLFAGEPVARAILGVLGNLFEVWVAWFILVRLGKFDGHLDSVRSIAALAVASVAGGATASISYPLLVSLTGGFDFSNWDSTVIRYAFANSCGTLIVFAALYSLRRNSSARPANPQEFIIWLLVACFISAFAFNAIFTEKTNYAFLLFPLVLYASVRFGSRGCAAALVLVVIGIYISLARFGSLLSEDQLLPAIQFMQGFVWVLAVTGLFLAALVSERRRAEESALKEKTRSLEAQLHEERARLQALRYQIDPHFLFNSLNSVSASLPDSNENSRRMLAKMADYMRTLLEYPEADFLPIGLEIETVRKYVEIERLRFEKRLQVSIESDPGINEMTIPALILQPLVENAIRHGGSDREAGLQIDIGIRKVDDFLRIQVKNEGPWREQPGRKGIGLENIRQRLKLLYDGKASMKIEKMEQSVDVRIDLPADIDRTTNMT